MRRMSAAVLAIGFVLSACSAYEVNQGKPVAVGEDRLELVEKGEGVYHLKVSKAALQSGTEFLLSTSMIDRLSGEPAFMGMLSRVVYFKRADGKVHMLESNRGTAVEPSLVKSQIMMSFPVLAEDNTTVSLGFNEGAQSVFITSDWWGSDFAWPSDAAFYRNFINELKHAYVDEGVTDAQGRISIRQVANVDSWGLADPVELRYFLQPYRPDATYRPMRSTQDFRRVGFFEATPTVRRGSASFDVFVARFHPSKPLTYAISANTPPSARQAIRDGILYWNRALGREWITVVDAPAGVTAPSLDYNLIQWVDEKGALFAYADAQLDPLTGQVTNAQVFLPSGWYFSTLDEAVYSYARLPDASVAKGKVELSRLRGARLKPTLQSSRSIGACQRGNAHHFTHGIQALAARGLGPAELNRVSLDWVRAVVAHEVGHTLGLRHNFAGSLGTNIERSESADLMKDYFATGNWPAAKVPGSSVMEYPSFEDDVAIGARIRLGQPALAYDAAAMGVLYGNASVPTNGPLFCTDSEEYGKALDCLAFDHGASFVDGRDEVADRSVANAAAEYLFWLRAAKSSARSDLFAFMDGQFDGISAYAPRYDIVRALSNGSYLLAAERAVLSVTPAEQEAIHLDSLDRVHQSVLAGGGYGQYFETLPEDFATTFTDALNQLLAERWATQGRDIRGNFWMFSPAELARIRAYAPAYLKGYTQGFAAAEISVLGMNDPWSAYYSQKYPEFGGYFSSGEELRWEARELSTGKMEQLLSERAQAYITASTGTHKAKVMVMGEAANGEEPKPTEKEVDFPVFTYETALRSKAVNVMEPSHSKDHAWAWEERKAFRASVEAFMTAVAGVPLDKFELEGSSDFAKNWIFDNRQVMGGLDSVASAPPSK